MTSPISLVDGDGALACAERTRAHAVVRAMTRSGLLCVLAVAVFAAAADAAYLPQATASVLGMGVGFVLVRRGRWVGLGTHVAFATGTASVAWLTVRYGDDSGAQYLFAVMALSALACYPTPARRWGSFAVAAATATAALTGWLPEAFAAPAPAIAHELTFFTLLTLAAVYWTSDDLLRINRAFRLRSRAVVDEIGARSAELAGDLARLGRQSDELAHANEALSVEVAHGESVGRELRVRREELSQFVYAASHDLKEPLRSISGFVQLLRRRLASHGDADLDAYTDIVLRSSAGMSELLDGLLRYSRAGATDADAGEVDLGRLALLVRHDLGAYAAACGGSVEVAPGLGTGYCRGAGMREILREVVHNALKFAAPGQAPRVEIGPSAEGGDGCVVVRDYGIGIEAGFRERVFLLFQRLHHVDDYGGAGIGLALARKLADADGVDIAVASPREGPGTVFLISCRAATPPQTSDR